MLFVHLGADIATMKSIGCHLSISYAAVPRDHRGEFYPEFLENFSLGIDASAIAGFRRLCIVSSSALLSKMKCINNEFVGILLVLGAILFQGVHGFLPRFGAASSRIMKVDLVPHDNKVANRGKHYTVS